MNAWGIGFCILAGLGALAVIYRTVTSGIRAEARQEEAKRKAREEHIAWLNERRRVHQSRKVDAEDELWSV